MTTEQDTGVYYKFAESVNGLIHRVAPANGRVYTYGGDHSEMTACGVWIEPASWHRFNLRNTPVPESADRCGRCFK